MNQLDSSSQESEKKHQPSPRLAAHLGELQIRLIISALSFGFCLLLFMGIGNHLSAWMKIPLQRAVNGLDLPKEQMTRLTEWNVLDPIGGLVALLKVSFYFALAMSLPVLLHQLWQFIRPGLWEHERRAVRPVLVPVTLLFIAGGLVGFFYASPLALRFLIQYNLWIGVENQWTASSVISLVQTISIGFGIAFELPIALLLLGKIGIISSRQLRQNRRVAILISFILGAIFTPPDPATQIMMAGILLALYEVGILLVRISERKKTSAIIQTNPFEGAHSTSGKTYTENYESDNLMCEDECDL